MDNLVFEATRKHLWLKEKILDHSTSSADCLGNTTTTTTTTRKNTAKILTTADGGRGDLVVVATGGREFIIFMIKRWLFTIDEASS